MAGSEVHQALQAAALPLSFLVMSSVLPVVKVLLIAAHGLIFALPYFDVLHADARKSLSKSCRPFVSPVVLSPLPPPPSWCWSSPFPPTLVVLSPLPPHPRGAVFPFPPTLVVLSPLPPHPRGAVSPSPPPSWCCLPFPPTLVVLSPLPPHPRGAVSSLPPPPSWCCLPFPPTLVVLSPLPPHPLGVVSPSPPTLLVLSPLPPPPRGACLPPLVVSPSPPSWCCLPFPPTLLVLSPLPPHPLGVVSPSPPPSWCCLPFPPHPLGVVSPSPPPSWCCLPFPPTLLVLSPLPPHPLGVVSPSPPPSWCCLPFPPTLVVLSPLPPPPSWCCLPFPPTLVVVVSPSPHPRGVVSPSPPPSWCCLPFPPPSWCCLPFPPTLVVLSPCPQLVFTVFLPAIIFVNLGEAISFENLLKCERGSGVRAGLPARHAGWRGSLTAHRSSSASSSCSQASVGAHRHRQHAIGAAVRCVPRCTQALGRVLSRVKTVPMRLPSPSPGSMPLVLLSAAVFSTPSDLPPCRTPPIPLSSRQHGQHAAGAAVGGVLRCAQPFGGHNECNKLGTAYISLGMWVRAWGHVGACMGACGCGMGACGCVHGACGCVHGACGCVHGGMWVRAWGWGACLGDGVHAWGMGCMLGGWGACVLPGAAWRPIVMWSTVYNILAPPEEWLPGYVRPLDHFGIDHKYVDAPMVPYHEEDDSDSDDGDADGEGGEEGWEVPGGWEAALGVGVEAVSSRPLVPGEGKRAHHTTAAAAAAVSGGAVADGTAGLHAPLLAGTPQAAGGAEGRTGAAVPRLGSVGGMEAGQQQQRSEGSVRGGRVFGGSSLGSSVARTASRSLRKASVALLVRAPNTVGEVLKALHIYDVFPTARPRCLSGNATGHGTAAGLPLLPPRRGTALPHRRPRRAGPGHDSLHSAGSRRQPRQGPRGVCAANAHNTSGGGDAAGGGAAAGHRHCALRRPRGAAAAGDKMFRFVLLLQHAMPSSIQI
ncbi:unnamed protein product, partial [Closterium sp. NIES-64]